MTASSLSSLLTLLAALAGGSATAALVPRGRAALARRRLVGLCPPPPGTRGKPPRRSVAIEREEAGPLLRGLVVLAPVGTASLVAGWPFGPLLGLGAGYLAGRWLRRRVPMAERRRRARIEAALPIAVDLLAAVLRAGGQLTSALDAVARSLGGPLGAELQDTAERLRLGADPVDTWRRFREPRELAALGRTLARASRTGAPLAEVLDRFAADCRHAAHLRTVELAQRTGVFIVGPLGLCFLPAFALIGVLPLAAGLVSGLDLPH